MALGKNLKKTKEEQPEESVPEKPTRPKSKIKEVIKKDSSPKEVEVKGNPDKPKASMDVEAREIKKKQLKQFNESVSSEETVSSEKIMLIVFPVGNEEYAISIDAVSEVVSAPPIAPIPQAPKYIIGASNVRGNVLAILNLEQRFGLQIDSESTKQFDYVLVLKNEAYKMALAIDKVPDTILIDVNQIDLPSALTSNSRIDDTYIKGIIKIDKRMIIMIDVIEMVESNEVTT